jgi:hypothetical protein
MILLAISVLQLIAPGAPLNWFGADFRPNGWAQSEAGLYLLTELIPVLAFIGIGVLFWWRGTATRVANAAAELSESAELTETNRVPTK